MEGNYSNAYQLPATREMDILASDSDSDYPSSTKVMGKTSITNASFFDGYMETTQNNNGLAPSLKQNPSDATRVPPAGRIGKKRSRASRRAPTTVLTTDTSNFRAMVQEFTGIPPAPFAPTSNSSSSVRRFDLFTSRTTTGGAGIGHPFLLRPFTQSAPGFVSATQRPSAQSFLPSINKVSNSSSAGNTVSAEQQHIQMMMVGYEGVGSRVDGGGGGRNPHVIESWISTSSSSDQTLDKLVL